jgi:cytochrome c oxidase subunit II
MSLPGTMSAMDPASAQAAQIASLSWWMFGFGAAVLLGVTALVLVAMLRARGSEHPRPLADRHGYWLVWGGGVLLPLASAIALLVASLAIGRTTEGRAPADAMTVEVTGHRWWWEIHYLDARGDRIAGTANEMHVPVGRAVRFKLKSSDVIHSFWAPNVQGKTDMVPGHTNEAWFRVDHAGTWRGQCAEFCGVQHALMGFVLVARPPTEFDAWLRAQAQPAAAPASELARLGQQVFESRACVMCHAVRGTVAGGQVAPDLTHIATRQTLAAGRLPNNRGSLAAWILDPQQVKPGTLMPATPLSGDELHALLDYLEGLH